MVLPHEKLALGQICDPHPAQLNNFIADLGCNLGLQDSELAEGRCERILFQRQPCIRAEGHELLPDPPDQNVNLARLAIIGCHNLKNQHEPVPCS